MFSSLVFSRPDVYNGGALAVAAGAELFQWWIMSSRYVPTTSLTSFISKLMIPPSWLYIVRIPMLSGVPRLNTKIVKANRNVTTKLTDPVEIVSSYGGVEISRFFLSFFFFNYTEAKPRSPWNTFSPNAGCTESKGNNRVCPLSHVRISWPIDPRFFIKSKPLLNKIKIINFKI